MTASIWRNEGPRGFFKGLMTPLVTLSLISSITFPCYSWFRVQFGANKGWDTKNAMAGFACAPVTFPITNLEGLIKVCYLLYYEIWTRVPLTCLNVSAYPLIDQFCGTRKRNDVSLCQHK